MPAASAEAEALEAVTESAAPAARVTLPQGVRALVGWLATSLAGLTAIIYAAGYFLFHAHLNMLGLGDVVGFPHEQMLLEGGRFFFFCIGELIRYCLVGGVLLAVVLIAAAMLREIPFAARTSGLVSDWAWRRRMVLTATHPRLEAAVVLAVFVALLALHAKYFYYPLYALQGLSDLLYATPQPALATPRACAAFIDSGPALDALARRIVTSGTGPCQGALVFAFQGALEDYLLLVIGAAITFYYTARARDGLVIRLMRLLLGAYALMFTLMLPVAFGVLVRLPIYPIVDVTLRDGTRLHAKQLERTSASITLWDGAARRTIWRPLDGVGSIQVSGEGNLFDR